MNPHAENPDTTVAEAIRPTAERAPLGYYRHPSMDGQTPCPECGHIMHEHGWLDSGGDGIAACPSKSGGPFAGQTVTEWGLAKLDAVPTRHETPPAPDRPSLTHWKRS